MNEAWMDECAARLQSLVDQYKLRQHQTFAIEKFQDLIVTTPFCPGDKKSLFLIALSPREMYLQFNKLTFISSEAFINLNSLQVTIPKGVFAKNEREYSLTLNLIRW